jgi:hypothetical protein
VSAVWVSVAVLTLWSPRGSACGAPPAVERLRPDAPVFADSTGIDEAGQFLARNADEWTGLWARIQARRRPTPPRPEIDFDHDMIVVAALGRQRTGGYSIRIDRALREGGATVIVVRTESPGPGCIVPASLTSPVDVAKLPLTPGPVEFRVESSVRDCN